MIFPTLDFLLFFLVVWVVSWGLLAAGRHQLHKIAIVAASYFFYACWSWRLTFLLAFNVLLNWSVGRFIGSTDNARWRKLAVTIGVGANLAVLGFFKYYGWFAGELGELLTTMHVERELPLLEIILPVGISFFTFQGISYVVDVYRGDLDRPRGLLDVGFFLSFFPHLVAGPIVRASAFLPQLERPPNPNRVFVSLGVMLIVWGVFKKAVIANWLAVGLVDPAFRDPSGYGALDLGAAIYGYAVQIYCDFSAYSDIAIGAAALLGYRFQRNFNQPYRAASIADFWRRWHISLSTWLRDYLFIPLGGSRGGKWKTYRNLLLTMLLGGIWHGAAWSFALWGTLHGAMLSIERFFLGLFGLSPVEGVRDWHPVMRLLGILLTFHLVCLCWVLFRAADLERAGQMIMGLAQWQQPVQLLTPFLFAMIAIGMGVQFTPPDMIERLDRLYHRTPVAVVGVLAGLSLLLIDAVGGDASAPFIYFQF
jgi:alginate O-acetyltransferase complex protein AlgI